MRKHLYCILLPLLLSSCAQVPTIWGDLDTLEGLVETLDKDKAFVPYAAALDDGETTACIAHQLDELEAARQESDTVGQNTPLRTTSTNTVELAKSVFSFWHSHESVSYCGTYMSTDQAGKPIRLSGRIVLPTKERPKRIIIVSHYTIGCNEEAPSKSFPLEGIFASRGLAVVVPDYLGYGATQDHVHPYLCSDLTAQNVLDMYGAALPLLKALDKMPEHPEVILFGYSQGGATTMALARKIEYEHPEIRLRLILAGGGPYDICVTYDKMMENDYTDYPCAIPMIIQGMNVGHGLELDYAEFFQTETLHSMDEWINSKRYTMAQITRMMGTKQLSHIMTKEACDKASDKMLDLYMAMLNNSISVSYYPKAPVYMFHSMDDNVVPFDNAESLLGNIQGRCNVQYNFGHYGNHVAGYLRFLYTSINYLYEHEEITSKSAI